MAKTIKSHPGNSDDIRPNEINPAGPNTEGQTEAVSNAVASLADLTWEERKYFMRRYSEVYSQEADLRSQGKDFDVEAYRL